MKAVILKETVIYSSLGNAIGTLLGGGNYSKGGVVSMKQCDCDERIGIKINSWKQFQELKEFFEGQVEKGLFIELAVDKPYGIGYDGFGGAIEWYADKWYKCLECGVLWEFEYPDFPALGFVRKLSSGEYYAMNYDERCHMILNE